VGEPFHLRLEEIMRLTPWQIESIYFHDRDPKTGIPRDERAQEDMRTFFRRIWKNRGLEDHQIEAKWQAWVEEQRKKKPG
jgi:hypothetical protein